MNLEVYSKMYSTSFQVWLLHSVEEQNNIVHVHVCICVCMCVHAHVHVCVQVCKYTENMIKVSFTESQE